LALGESSYPPPFSFARKSSNKGALRKRPLGLHMTVQELFHKWIDACGGERAWKGLIDINFRLKHKTSGSIGMISMVMQEYERNVFIKMQPKLRIKSIFIDPKTKKKTVYGRDSKGWFAYWENVLPGKGWSHHRKPDIFDDFKTKEMVSYDLKGIGFWLGIPFLMHQDGVKLKFAGFLKPGKVPSGSEEVRKPLPMLEVDLTALNDWPIDLVTVAFHPHTFLPVEARYRFTDQEGAWHICAFHEYKKINGIVYPSIRRFYKDDESWEIEERMTKVRVNTHIHESHFRRPGPMVQWNQPSADLKSVNKPRVDLGF